MAATEPIDERAWRPGETAIIRFPDGEWRAATLTEGFFWVTADEVHVVTAIGGFEVRPLLSVVRVAGASTKGDES